MPNNAPRRLVEFSRSALNSNLDAVATLGINTVIDLRCDAYGHGADWVGDAARERGFTAFVTDDEPHAPVPESAGMLYGTTSGERVAVLSGELVALKSISAGESVSYGYTWTAQRETRLGLVSLGFADGLPRAGSNIGQMTVSGREVSVIGRVAMDQCVVNLEDVDARVGGIVHVWGSIPSLTTWATAAQREPLSLIAGLSWRVQRAWGA